MHIDPATHSTQDNYKVLSNIVVPRPIAWVTSQNAAGVVNLAPFSFFNAIGSEPLLVMFSVAHKDDQGGLKDTARNILAQKEFVVNLVTEDVFHAMNISAADFPPEESELVAAGLHTAASEKVKVPRVAEAQASMECTLHSTIPVGNYTLIIGQVVMFHVADHLVGERLHINGFNPMGRMGSPSYYCRTTDRLELTRMTYEKWQEEKKG